MAKKKIILLVVIGISLAIVSLYATYAINVTSEEGTPNTYDTAFSFDLTGGLINQLTIEAGKTKVFDIDITNPYTDSVQYGIGYELISPTTFPEGLVIAQSSLSENSAVGLVEASSTISISLIIVNETTSDITIELEVINGYKNGGDLIVGTKTLIEDVYQIDPSESYKTLKSLKLTDLVNEGTPDFIAIAETDEGIYAAEDDLGTSYYFRGASERNYVKFGKNSSGSDMYWRIIRINGDGTVRMIYDGTQAYDNGTSSTDRYVGESAFNSSYNSNGYVGYMYGSTLGSTYALEHANDVNSTIKTYLEGEPSSTNTGWYYENIIATGYDDYVADAIYCNDRTLDTTSTSYTGIDTTQTYYAAYQRLERNYTTSVNPVLTCEREEDRFTSEATIGSVTGNDELKYPVGLITADEVSMAGGLSYTDNSNYYLYMGSYYWAMSPSGFDGKYAYEFSVNSAGRLNVSLDVHGAVGVRPVLSLSSTALIGGTGEKGDPFRVES